MKITGFINNEIGINFKIELALAMVDSGIGSYEFWGSKGIDSNVGLEDEGFSIESLKTEAGETIQPTEAIEKEIQKIIDKNWKKIEQAFEREDSALEI